MAGSVIGVKAARCVNTPYHKSNAFASLNRLSAQM